MAPHIRFLNVKPKTRTFPGTDFGSDHGLVLMTIKPKLATNRKNTDLQLYLFDLDKLQHPNISTEWVEEWNALGERSTKWHARGIIPNAHLASGTDEPWSTWRSLNRLRVQKGRCWAMLKTRQLSHTLCM